MNVQAMQNMLPKKHNMNRPMLTSHWAAGVTAGAAAVAAALHKDQACRFGFSRKLAQEAHADLTRS